MADPTKILQAIQQIGTETVEQGVKETQQAISTVITGQELVADAKPMSEGEMAKAKTEDEQKRQEEMNKLRGEGSVSQGRNVEAEIKQVIDEKKNEEDQKEKEFLEEIQRQREEENREREALEAAEMGPKHQKGPQGPSGQRKKKSQAPDPTSMSATSEFKGGKID